MGLAIGKIDYGKIPDATLSGRPPHLINLVAVFDPNRQPSTTIGKSAPSAGRN